MKHRDFSVSRQRTSRPSSPPGSKEKYKYLEFKHIYFSIQKLINKRVNLSLKYDQLNSPEINATLVKPIAERIVKLAEKMALSTKIARVLPTVPANLDQTPHFGPHKSAQASRNDHPIPADDDDSKLSTCLPFILLLLRYEYQIQSENNLISFEILNTKATLCELLAIRMLKEYRSFNRINLLFSAPLKNEFFHQDHRYTFNTLELSVLSKSKRFLSQPVIIRTLERFYNGELISKAYTNSVDNADLIVGEEHGLLDRDVVNYKYNRITFNKIIKRSNIVPKYQSLVINLKLMLFMVLYFVLITSKQSHTKEHSITHRYFLGCVETSFWLLGLNFNIEFLMKILNIEVIFMKKIIWNYVDLLLIILIDISFVLKFVNPQYYRDSLSLVSIILLPRTLSVFNNYQFFNLIVLGFKKMAWNLMGLICLFFSLISGFYFSFITLSIDLTNLQVLSNMARLFFGYTPSVWNYWDNYNTLGKIIVIGYLFLIQFILGSILAITLSGVFHKVNSNNHQEFNYFKTVNLILYLKTSQLNEYKSHLVKKTGSVQAIKHFVSTRFYEFLNVFKFPVILVIFLYEMIISKFYLQKLANNNQLKNYTFLSRSDHYYQDHDLITLETFHRKLTQGGAMSTPYQHDFGEIDGIDDVLDDEDIEENDDISILLMKSRKASAFRQLTNNTHSTLQGNGRRYSQIDNINFSRLHLSKKNLFGTTSVGTLRGKINTASNESLLADGLQIKRPREGANMHELGPVLASGESLGSPIRPSVLLEKVRTNNSETRKFSEETEKLQNPTIVNDIANNGASGSSSTHTLVGPNDSAYQTRNYKRYESEILERLIRLEELLTNKISLDSFNETIQAVAQNGDCAENEYDEISSIVHRGCDEDNGMLEDASLLKLATEDDTESDHTF